VPLDADISVYTVQCVAVGLIEVKTQDARHCLLDTVVSQRYPHRGHLRAGPSRTLLPLPARCVGGVTARNLGFLVASEYIGHGGNANWKAARGL
jgi:hypothetical protein